MIFLISCKAKSTLIMTYPQSVDKRLNFLLGDLALSTVTNAVYCLFLRCCYRFSFNEKKSPLAFTTLSRQGTKNGLLKKHLPF